MSESVRDASRRNFQTLADNPSWQEVRDGALLRIADATEAMAQNHTRLINERDMYQRFYEQERAERRRLTRQVNALRGVITRMKNAREAAR